MLEVICWLPALEEVRDFTVHVALCKQPRDSEPGGLRPLQLLLVHSEHSVPHLHVQPTGNRLHGLVRLHLVAELGEAADDALQLFHSSLRTQTTLWLTLDHSELV